MEKEIRKEVDDAVAQAKVIILIVSSFVFVTYISKHLLIPCRSNLFQESPVPDASELFTNMYVKDCGVEVLLHPFHITCISSFVTL